jgi:hypothetical protein
MEKRIQKLIRRSDSILIEIGLQQLQLRQSSYRFNAMVRRMRNTIAKLEEIQT